MSRNRRRFESIVHSWRENSTSSGKSRKVNLAFWLQRRQKQECNNRRREIIQFQPNEKQKKLRSNEEAPFTRPSFSTRSQPKCEKLPLDLCHVSPLSEETYFARSPRRSARRASASTSTNRLPNKNKNYDCTSAGGIPREAKSGSHRQQSTKMPTIKREWRSAVDPKSGRTYYYDVISRETQWRKPIELATEAERRKIEEKEKKQLDFFQSMEANMFRAMDRGEIPGASTIEEDVVKPLPTNAPSSRKKPKKPTLIRTISSMDDELLAELAKGSEEREISNAGFLSPGTTATSFFDSLPQPACQHPLLSSPPLTTSEKIPSFHRTVTPPRNELSKQIQKPTLRKRNTCGSLYIKNTMADPDKDAAIKCLCGVYRTHILHSSKAPMNQTKFDDYEVFNDHYSRHQFTNCSNALIMETGEAIEMMQIEDKIPSLDEITSFYRFVFNKAQMESDCIIISLIYVERLLRETKGGVRPNVNNWRSVLFSCMVLASKVWDDLSMWNADFSHACPSGTSFSLQRINQLEVALLSCLKYTVKVPASEYAKYYFLMRSMLIRSGLAGQDILSSSPLDAEGARQLESLSSNYNSNPPSKLRRCRSANGLDMDASSKSPNRSCHVNLEQVVRM